MTAIHVFGEKKKGHAIKTSQIIKGVVEVLPVAGPGGPCGGSGAGPGYVLVSPNVGMHAGSKWSPSQHTVQPKIFFFFFFAPTTHHREGR